MSLPYSTITVVRSVVTEFADEAVPALPFAYFATLSDAAGYIVLYPEPVFDVPNAGDFAAALISQSRQGAIVVLAIVDGEDTMRLRFFLDGNPVDEYCTEPGRANGEELPPSGGDAAYLARLFGITDADTVSELSDVLRATRFDDQFGYGESRERHGEIAHLLNLPPACVGIGYESLQRGRMPEGITVQTLRHHVAVTGISSSEGKLNQYALFRPKANETSAEIASRFLPDVISWEDDFFDEPLPSLGTVEYMETYLSSKFPTISGQPFTQCVSSIKDDSGAVTIDLGNTAREYAIESANVFTLSTAVPVILFARLCDGMPWAVWSYGSRQIVCRSAAISD